ncbi:MAG: Holliday junction resolvase RuvX [Phototrophicaceae bacterium]
MIGRLLGIDHGLARIGLAVSDALGITATELRVINRTSKAADFALLNQIIAEEGVVAIVVGMPNNEAPEGVHTQADTVRLWIERFKQTTTLPIIEWDEQLSSIDATEIAKRQGRGVRDAIDDLAARVILQSYINAVHDGLATPPPRT